MVVGRLGMELERVADPVPRLECLRGCMTVDEDYIVANVCSAPAP